MNNFWACTAKCNFSIPNTRNIIKTLIKCDFQIKFQIFSVRFHGLLFTKMKNRIFSRSIGIKENFICFDWQQMIWKMFLFSFSPYFFRFVFSKRKKTQSTLEFHFTAIMHMIFNAEVLLSFILIGLLIDKCRAFEAKTK